MMNEMRRRPSGPPPPPRDRDHLTRRRPPSRSFTRTALTSHPSNPHPRPSSSSSPRSVDRPTGTTPIEPFDRPTDRSTESTESTARRHRLTARLASSRLARLPSASAHLPICVLDLVHISRHFAAVSLASRARVASRASHRLDSVSTARAHAVAASPTRRSSARNVARSVSSRIADFRGDAVAL